MKIQVTFEVDKKTVTRAADTLDVMEAINKELGWVAQSGIYVKDVSVIENDGPSADDLPDDAIA